MTWPFENDMTATIKKLAKSDLKAHKLKTFLTAIIIVISTCLMATVFSVIINDALTRTSQAPYHAMYRSANENVKSKLQSDNDFEAVGVYKLFGNIVDSDGRIDLAYMDEQAMSFMGFQFIDGEFPENRTDVLVSKTFLKDRSLSLGDTFLYRYTDTLTNTTQEEEFTICGIIQNEMQESGKLFYILTSDSFRMDYAERYSTISSDYSTQTASTVDLLVLLNSEMSNISPEEQKDFLKSKGVTAGIASFDIFINDSYINGVYFDGAVVIGILFFALFLIFASSFVIYSIFLYFCCQFHAYVRSTYFFGYNRKAASVLLKNAGQYVGITVYPYWYANLRSNCDNSLWNTMDLVRSHYHLVFRSSNMGCYSICIKKTGKIAFQSFAYRSDEI